MRLTVMVPTHRRPAMLRSALASIANQSSVSQIAEVIVSENSDDVRSRDVCLEFSDLPIRHVTRVPVLEPGSHFCQILSEVRTELVALLADDDMWSRQHLAEAMTQLEQHPGAVGYFGQVVVVDNDSRQITSPYGRPIHSYMNPASSTFRRASVWTAKEVLVESLLRTPLCMWSLVGRTASIREAAAFLLDGPGGLDSDRFFAWRLSCRGEIVVGAEVSLFMRIHRENACARMASEAGGFHRSKAREYSETMIGEADRMGIDWRTLWTEWWGRLGDDERVLVCGNRLPGTLEPLKEAIGPSFPWPRSLSLRLPLNQLRSLVPPLLVPLLKRSLGSLWGASTAKDRA
jgi:hypothetical protein